MTSVQYSALHITCVVLFSALLLPNPFQYLLWTVRLCACFPISSSLLAFLVGYSG